MQYVKRIPTPIAGVALGLAGAGNLLVPFGMAFLWGCMLLSLLACVLLAIKVATCFNDFKSDLANPLMAGIVPAAFMAVMQIAGAIALINIAAGFILWALAVTAHVVYLIWFLCTYFRRPSLQKVFPTIFVTLAGIMMAGATAPNFYVQSLGLLFVWAGLILFLVSFGFAAVRVFKMPLPDAAQPTVCICAAPLSLALVGYLACEPNPSVVIAGVMLMFGQVLFAFAVVQLPRLLKMPFYPSQAAMTFPFVISALALSQGMRFMLGAAGSQSLQTLSGAANYQGALFPLETAISQGALFPLEAAISQGAQFSFEAAGVLSGVIDVLVIAEGVLALALTVYVIIRYAKHILQF